MLHERRYKGDYEKLPNQIDIDILNWEFDTVLKQAGLLLPGDVDAYSEAVWERLKAGE